MFVKNKSYIAMKKNSMSSFLAKVFAGNIPKTIAIAMLFIAFALLLASCGEELLSPDPVVTVSKPIVKLPNVVTAQVSVASETIVRSGGEIFSDGGSTVTARGICWSTAASPDVTNGFKTLDGTGIGAFTSTLSGLTPGATYYIRSYAINSAGTAYGNETSVTLDKQKFNITATSSAGGTISPTGSVQAVAGDNAKFSWAANSGYEVELVTVNGVKILPLPTSYTFNNVSSNTNSIAVTFIKSIFWAGVNKTASLDSVYRYNKKNLNDPTSKEGWGYYQADYGDSIRFNSNGKCSFYHLGTEYNYDWSIDLSQDLPIINYGGNIQNIYNVSSSGFVLGKKYSDGTESRLIYKFK